MHYRTSAAKEIISDRFFVREVSVFLKEAALIAGRGLIGRLSVPARTGFAKPLMAKERIRAWFRIWME